MELRQHGRRAADTRVKTPLTELTESLSANYGVVGRRAAVVAAAGGLVVTATLPAMGADDEGTAAVAAESEAQAQTAPEFVNQAKTVVPQADEDDSDLVGAVSVENVTATAAPEPAPEPEPAASSESSDDSSSSDSSSSEGSGSSSSSGDEKSKGGDVALPDGSKAEQVIAIAKQYTGVPYVSGGTTPSGWDCSGFTSFVYNKVGVNLPRTSGAQKSAGRVVSASEAKPGDLVWHPGHVGIYAGNGMMYDAGSPSSGTSYRSHSWMGSVTYIRVL
ncbi:C40 family peptidase [Brevibacterium sp.]|uniref:C40 family peptidase n=1 Tax=Brevibacterium sp. TaxID=1701 RepID=UPI0025BA2CFE|nr:C40 family peptidase [Brevibacterium sp.]